MTQREPWKVVVFGIITLGIYDIFWLYSTRKEMVALGQQIPRVIWLFLPYIVFLALLVVQMVMLGVLSDASRSSTGFNILNVVILIGEIIAIFASIPVWLYWFYKYSQAIAAMTRNKMPFGMAYGLSILFSVYGLSSVWAGMIQYEFNSISPDPKPAAA